MSAARMAHNGVATVPLKGRRPYIDALDLPAHEPRMDGGFFVAQRTVKNRR
jgi:hypothetical protein